MSKPVMFTYNKKRSYNDYQNSMFDRIIQDVSNNKKKRITDSVSVKTRNRSANDEYDFENESRIAPSLRENEIIIRSIVEQKPTKKKARVLNKVEKFYFTHLDSSLDACTQF